MEKEPVYLLDATAFCYRAFYAVRGLATSYGQPTNAVFGYLNILQKILKERSPRFLGVCFDVSRATFRQQKFADYKIQRPPAPAELSSQFPFIKQLTAAYGLPIFEKEGYEADDVIATIAAQAQARGDEVVIISADKDILQLVAGGVTVLSPGKDGDVVYDRRAVMERFGVEPDKIPDIIALMGDSVDNIPGVPGVGEKTAMNLIREFGGVAALMSGVAGVKQEKLRASLIAHKERILLNRELAVLDRAVPLSVLADDLRLKAPEQRELFRLFKQLEFKSHLKSLSAGPDRAAAVASAAAAEADSAQLEEFFGSASRVVLGGAAPDDLVIADDERCVRAAPAARPALERILGDDGVGKVGYDLKALRGALARGGVMLRGLEFDVMIAAYLLNPARGGFDLAGLAADYLDEQVAPGLPAEAQARIIGRLAGVMRRRLEQDALVKLFTEVEMPLVEVLAEMEDFGITLDRAMMSGLSVDIEQRLAGIISGIFEASGVEFNINSPKQLRDVLFDRLKLPVVKRTKTGPSTDEEVLRVLAGNHRLPELLLEYRQLSKLKNTYVDALPLLIDPKTGRIHTSFNQSGTETGRLSSSNPNLQNIPVKTEIGRNIRRAFIASGPSRVLLSCDYSQIELRILAHLCADERLKTAFREDKDIHNATAALVYGVKEEAVTAAMRDAAKRVNFGIIYGLTAYGLSRDLNLPIEEAQAFIDAYFDRYPGVKSYIQRQIARAEADGYVTTILGRRRAVPQIKDRNPALRQFAQRQAVNTPVQGSAADLIKLAMLAIHRELSARRLSSRMVLQVHDELVFDCEEREMPQVRAFVKQLMEGVLELDVPIKVDMKQGKNWLDMEKV